MKAKPRFVCASLAFAACIGIGFASSQLKDEFAYAVEWPPVDLEFDFVSDEVEAALTCDIFESCLHIEVLNTANCETSVSVDLGLENKFGQLLGNHEMVVPSPAFKGGFVIEIGSNQYDTISTYGIYSVSCTALLPNVFGIA